MKRGVFIHAAACGATLLLLHSIAAAQTGAVVSWGLEVMPAAPSAVRCKAVAAGADFSMALGANGTVLAWGNNEQGQCRLPHGLNCVESIAAGQSHALALQSDGTVAGWGDNTYNQSLAPAGLNDAVADESAIQGRRSNRWRKPLLPLEKIKVPSSGPRAQPIKTGSDSPGIRPSIPAADCTREITPPPR